jgi:DNA (cytosine-5)-methyltransferase 1
MKVRRFLVGMYRRIPSSSYGQYWYTCEACGQRCEPYILPAATAIDWTDLGTPIGLLDEPLKPNTMRRIRDGIATSCSRVRPFMVNSNHDDDRIYPVDRAPLPTRTVKIGDGLCLPPMLPPMLVPCGGTWADDATSAVGEPMRTRLANEKGYEALWTPEPFIAMLRKNSGDTSIREPLATFAAGGTHHALIVPYYTKGTARSTAEPLDTVTVRDRFAMVKATDGDVMAARYRMLKPRESLNAQRFPGTYVVTGNVGEQTMQAGNAVSANVACWIGRQVAAALDSRSAA